MSCVPEDNAELSDATYMVAAVALLVLVHLWAIDLLLRLLYPPEPVWLGFGPPPDLL